MRATHNVVVYMSDRSVSRRPHSFESSSSRAAQQAASAHAHFCRHDGARSGPRETARCVAFAFIDLRPLAAVLQIHLLLLLSHTYEIRVDIRDEIRNGMKFLTRRFFSSRDRCSLFCVIKNLEIVLIFIIILLRYSQSFGKRIFIERSYSNISFFCFVKVDYY